MRCNENQKARVHDSLWEEICRDLVVLSVCSCRIKEDKLMCRCTMTSQTMGRFRQFVVVEAPDWPAES